MSSQFYVHTSIYETEITEILRKLECESKKDVIDQLVELCDMEELLNLRLMIFGYAKTKLLSTLDLPRTEDTDPALAEFVSNDQFDDARTMVNEWQLIARRVDLRVATDAVDFLLYLSDTNPCFPHKIVKRSKKGRRIRRKSRRFRVKGSAQPKINFKPADPSNSSTGDKDCVGTTTIVDDPVPSDGDSPDLDSDESGDEEEGSSDDCDDDNSEGSLGDDRTSHEVTTSRIALPTTPDNTTRELSSHATQCASEDTAESDCGDLRHTASVSAAVPSTPYNAPPLPSVPEEPEKQAPARAVSVEVCPNPKPDPPVARPVQPIVQPDPLPPRSKENNLDQRPVARQSVSMAAQTEWDMWGPIGPSDNLMRPRKGACDCDAKFREIEEWRKELVRSATEQANQDRAKFNYLRQKLMESDEKMEKMKRSMDALAKECARKDSEAFSRRERQASPYDYTPEVCTSSESIWGDVVQPAAVTRTSACATSSYDKSGPEPPRSLAPDRNATIVIDDRNDNKPQRPPVDTGRELARASTSGMSDLRQSNNTGPIRNSAQLNRPKPSSSGGQTSSGHAGATSLARAGMMKEAPKKADQCRGAGSSATSTDQSWADDCISDIELAAIAIGSQPPTGGSQNLNSSRYPKATSLPTSRTGLPAKPADGGVSRNATPAVSNPQSGDKRCADDDANKTVDESHPESYADAAYKNQFKEPPRRKKRKAIKSSSDSELPDLSGFEDEPNREIFVKELAYAKCNKPSDLERMVKNHCSKRGVDILFAKTYLLRFSRDKANCRVKVKECDVNAVLSDDFWPRCVTARPWLTKPDFNAGKDDRSSDGELFSD